METKDLLNEFLSSLLEGVKQAGAFVKEQLPLVLQEYIAWGIAQGALYVLAGSVGLFIAWRVWSKLAHPGIKADKHDDGFGYYMATLFILLPIAIISFIVICDGVLMVTKAMVAPRVYLIEELGKLLK